MRATRPFEAAVFAQATQNVSFRASPTARLKKISAGSRRPSAFGGRYASIFSVAPPAVAYVTSFVTVMPAAGGGNARRGCGDWARAIPAAPAIRQTTRPVVLMGRFS